MKKIVLVAVILILLYSCVSVVRLTSYKVSNSSSNVSILLISQNLSVSRFDNDHVFWGPGFIAKKARIDFPSGFHTLEVDYRFENGYSTEEAKGMIVMCDFKPGMRYALTYRKQGNSIHLSLRPE
ncbi:MAG: hypothetical protein JXJ04_21925 [Spirochaetales bacterium]|nr:hypothetical protein [Spirochaetales bacterium]